MLIRKALRTKGKDSAYQDAAVQDAKTLLGLLHTHIGKVGTAAHKPFQGLLTLASTWEQNLRYLLRQHEKEVTTKGTANVVPPYTRIPWSEQQRPNQKMHPPPPMEKLNLATFGWWEVIPPTLENYTRLEAQLKNTTYTCARSLVCRCRP